MAAYRYPDPLRCPNCGKLYADLLAIGEAGGRVYGCGILGLKARCGVCKTSWGVNSAWKKRRVIDDSKVHFDK